jgi:hypothetical protein
LDYLGGISDALFKALSGNAETLARGKKLMDEVQEKFKTKGEKIAYMIFEPLTSVPTTLKRASKKFIYGGRGDPNRPMGHSLTVSFLARFFNFLFKRKKQSNYELRKRMVNWAKEGKSPVVLKPFTGLCDNKSKIYEHCMMEAYGEFFQT